MEPRESNNINSNQQGCGLKDSSWCCQFKNASNPLMARYVYGLIFLAANMLAWATRDELSSISALTELKGFKACKVGKDCLGAHGVLRVSMGCFSFVIGILAIVIATFSTGIDSKCFQLRKGDKPAEEDDVPYGYGFFHFVFATGAMYFAMLLIGWNTHHSMRKWSLDVGWTSAWVRIVNEWLAVCVYLWMLIAPIVWKARQTEST